MAEKPNRKKGASPQAATNLATLAYLVNYPRLLALDYFVPMLQEQE